jgi:hypothetical protein
MQLKLNSSKKHMKCWFENLKERDHWRGVVVDGEGNIEVNVKTRVVRCELD